MTDSSTASALRVAAAVTLALGVFLLLDSWDGLYDSLDLPQALPSLPTQLGGAGLLALAYVLWASASRPELHEVASAAGLISLGGGAAIIAGWLIFRDPEDDLGIDSGGTVVLIVIAVILAVVALALARAALGARANEP